VTQSTTSIEQDLARIGQLEGRAEEVESLRKGAQEEAGKALERLRRRIKAGETTGDRIKDFVLTRGYSLDESLVARYREVEERLARHVGELALFVVRERVLLRHDCFGGRTPRESDYGSTERWYLGLIESSELVLDLEGGSCAVLTRNYVTRKRALVLKEGNVPPVRHYEFPPSITDYLERTARMIDFGQPAVPRGELLIGNAEVEEWFTRHRGRDTVLCKAAQLLGKPMEYSDEYKERCARQRAKALEEISDELPKLATKSPVLKAALQHLCDLDEPDFSVISFSELCQKLGISKREE
jgi:hypothetical protein